MCAVEFQGIGQFGGGIEWDSQYSLHPAMQGSLGLGIRTHKTGPRFDLNPLGFYTFRYSETVANQQECPPEIIDPNCKPYAGMSSFEEGRVRQLYYQPSVALQLPVSDWLIEDSSVSLDLGGVVGGRFNKDESSLLYGADVSLGIGKKTAVSIQFLKDQGNFSIHFALKLESIPYIFAEE